MLINTELKNDQTRVQMEDAAFLFEQGLSFELVAVRMGMSEDGLEKMLARHKGVVPGWQQRRSLSVSG